MRKIKNKTTLTTTNINNYWTRLSKISWFVSGEQINYNFCRSRRLRQIIDLRDTEKSRYFAITEFNNCLTIRSPACFLLNIALWMVSEAICHFYARAITRRRKEWFYLRMSRTLFTAKTQLDDIAHEQTIICRELFTGHVVGSRPMKRKNSLLYSWHTIFTRKS